MKFYFQSKNLVISLSVLFIFSCTSNNNEDAGDKKYDEETKKEVIDEAEYISEITDETILGIITSFPSPLEISYLLKYVGADYSWKILNPANNKEKYITNFRKSLNLGIYGADLGYIYMYGQKQDAFTYLEIVHDLAGDLNVSHFFDFELIGRLAIKSESLDSLMIITTSNFEKINKYLREQDQVHLSVLMLTGGWLESIYILTQAAKQSNNQELNRRIGLQKTILDNIVSLLSAYQSDPDVGNLLSELKELKKLFDLVVINYTYKEPTYEEMDGMVMTIDQSTTTIKFPDGLLDKITRKINAIRNNVVS